MTSSQTSSVGRRREGARDRDALPLSAGELAWIAPGERGGQADLLEQPRHLGPGLLRVQAAQRSHAAS